jgi:hypothetical protein
MIEETCFDQEIIIEGMNEIEGTTAMGFLNNDMGLFSVPVPPGLRTPAAEEDYDITVCVCVSE